MTTWRACCKVLRQKSMTSGLLVVHQAGHVDRRGVDRGYTVVSMKDAVTFPGVDRMYDHLLRMWSNPWPLADVVAARIRTGEPVE